MRTARAALALLALASAAAGVALRGPSPAHPLTLPASSGAPGVASASAEARWREALGRREELEEKFSKFRRDLWEFQRSYPTGRVPEGAYRRAESAHRKLALKPPKLAPGLPASGEPAPSPVWKSRGPSPVDTSPSGLTSLASASGRATSLAIHPTQPSTMYLGTAQGGVWKSNDGGGSWAPLTDDQPSLAVGSIFLDPSAPDTVYAGTGEGHVGGISYFGRGLLKSTDGGQTWGRPAGERFSGVSIVKIAASKDGKRLYLATMFDSAGEGLCTNTYFNKPDQGLFASDDGGATWKTLLTGPVTDFEIDLTSPVSTLYVARYRKGLVRLVDDGVATPVKLPFLDEKTQPAAFGVELALAPSDPKVIYASPALSNNGINSTRGSLYVSKDGGDSWAEIPGAPDHCAQQCDYDNAVIVHPTDAGTVYFGGSLCAVWKLTGGTGATPVFSAVSLPGKDCSDAEKVWFNGSVHPDLHALAFAPDDPETVYALSDGGVGVSKNGGVSWTAPNNQLATLQFYGACLHPTDPEVMLGGTQDNGYLLTNGASTWNGILTGDGLGCAILPGNTTLFTVLGGTIFRAKFVGLFVDWSSFSVAFDPFCQYPGADGCGEQNAYFAPLAADPSNPEVLYLGSHRLWRSTEGGTAGSWKTFSGDLTGGPQGLSCSYAEGSFLAQDTLTGIGVSPDGQAIATISASGRVSTHDGPSGVWKTSSGKGLPKRYGSAVAIDAAKSGTLYASFSGFSEATPQTPGHVFRSENNGESWAGFEPGGIDIPTNTLLAHPVAEGVLFVGTDLGVMASYDGGQSWADVATGLPNVAVYWLGYHAASSQLVAATHGRSAWSVAFAPGFSAAPLQLSFSTEGDLGPKSVALQNPGHPASIQRVNAQASAPWISLPPGPLAVGAKAPVQLPVVVDPKGLAEGKHSATLTVTPTLGALAPVVVEVTLTVTPGGGQGGQGGQGGKSGEGGGAGSAGVSGSSGQSGEGGAGQGGLAGAGGQGSGGKGGSSGTSGQAGAGGAGPSSPGGSDVRPVSEPAGGCGCEVGGRPSGVGWGALVALLALRRGRRRRG